jgi:membrane protein DedA with SNARE-associated domain
MLGDLITYSIGRHFGRNIVREHHWFTRYVTPEREQKMEALIARRGPLVFFFARFMVGLRSPVYLAAGIMNVPFRRFIIIDTLCASSVIGLFFGLSYAFADHMQMWWQHIRQAELSATVIVVTVLATVLCVLYIRHRRSLAAEALLGAAKIDRHESGNGEVLKNGSPSEERSVEMNKR